MGFLFDTPNVFNVSQSLQISLTVDNKQISSSDKAMFFNPHLQSPSKKQLYSCTLRQYIFRIIVAHY